MFSVLIANYNNGHYIEEALDSVFEQTYSNWEVIIVDDGSTDKSGEVLKKYEEFEQIHIYYNKKNKGCGFTKRKCVEKANGEICGFLDPDDVLDPEALKIMVESHKENSGSGLIYSTYYGCNERLEPQFIPDWVGEFQRGETQLTASRISALATFKLSAYLKTEGINPSFRRAVDQDLYFKLEEVTDTKFVDKPLYYYRKHTNGISTFENRYKAKYWHLMAGFDACDRRGIDKEEYFSEFLKRHNKEIYLGDSKEYKLGRVLLKPLRKIHEWVK